MKEILIQIAGIVLLLGTSFVPPWDMPENAVYPGETEEPVKVYAEEENGCENGDFEPDMEYLGTFEATAYEWTGNPCANGNYPTVGYTVACNSLPLGTVLYVEGIGYRTVEDRGADWHSDRWLDLYMGDVTACYEWGVRDVEVYIVR